MAIVCLPPVGVFPRSGLDRATEVRVSADRWAGVYRELAARFPRVADKLVDPSGKPRGWFELFREQDGECLRYLPDAVVDDSERLILMFAVGGYPGSEA